MEKSITQIRPLARKLFCGKNFRFLTKSGERKPTLYFETRDDKGYTLLGRVRQEHPNGPKVSLCIGGGRVFFNPDNEQETRREPTAGFKVVEHFPGSSHRSSGLVEPSPLEYSDEELQLMVQQLIDEGRYTFHY